MHVLLSSGHKTYSNSEVVKRDNDDREEYYFDCQEPSSEVEECVCMHESAMLERSRLRPFLFNLPPALMLLIATVVAIMGRHSEPPAFELAKAEAAARAYLHSQPRTSSGPGGLAIWRCHVRCKK